MEPLVYIGRKYPTDLWGLVLSLFCGGAGGFCFVTVSDNIIVYKFGRKRKTFEANIVRDLPRDYYIKKTNINYNEFKIKSKRQLGKRFNLLTCNCLIMKMLLQ